MTDGFNACIGGGAEYYAAQINALKACGAIVKVEPDIFVRLVGKIESPLVVKAKTGFFKNKFRYLTNYKGLIFCAQSDYDIVLPADTEIVAAKKIVIPDLA